MKKSTLFFLALALVLSAVPVFADDVQDAINQAGFGVKEGSKEPEAGTTVIRDPNAAGGSRYSDSSSASGNTSEGYRLSATYLVAQDVKYKFKAAENQSPLPKPSAALDYYYPSRFYHDIGNVVIGLPPAASDPLPRWPSEPSGLYYEFAGERIKASESSIFRYSGDEWGDCLGPRCLDRGEFRQPVGSWVHFTRTRIEERNDLSNLLGFSDTLQAISNAVGQPVAELRNGRE